MIEIQFFILRVLCVVVVLAGLLVWRIYLYIIERGI